MYDARNNLSAQVDADVRSHFDGLVARHGHAKKCKGVGSAELCCKPALLYDPSMRRLIGLYARWPANWCAANARGKQLSGKSCE